jgi:uncharacterized protein YfaT (DUF1175 family)
MRSAPLSRRTIPIAAISFLIPLGVYFGWSRGEGGASMARARTRDADLLIAATQHKASPNEAAWHDSFGDGFPDGARLNDARDRENFVRWATFLAEALYYRPSPRALEEVQDCAALIRYAYRNALVEHHSAWRRSLPFEPGFADVTRFSYPQWPLGRGLFRTGPGPFAAADLESGAFAEFADAATLLHFNTFSVSRDVAAARPGDLLFFYQQGQDQSYHSMMFVGASHFQPRGDDWIIYHTGDLNGQGGEVRHLQASLLMQHPEPRWRPTQVNPAFLGVFRFNLLR